MKSFLITLMLIVGLAPISNAVPELLSLGESLSKIKVLENSSYKSLSLEEDKINISEGEDLEVMAKFNYEPFKYKGESINEK